jgi:hypothetical protein
LVDLDVAISGFWFVRRHTQNDYGAVCSLCHYLLHGSGKGVGLHHGLICRRDD